MSISFGTHAHTYIHYIQHQQYRSGGGWSGPQMNQQQLLSQHQSIDQNKALLLIAMTISHAMLF